MKYNSTKVYGDAEGPLGFPMRSDMAKEVESLIDGLDSDCKNLIDEAGGICRVAKAAKVDANLEDRTEVSVVTTETVDRDNEVILAKGLSWKQWAKNPVVTFAHNYSQLPAGRGVWAKKMDGASGTAAGRGYIAKTEYITKPEGWDGPWAPDAYWHYVKEGYMPAKSIGFIPTEVRPPNEKEIKARPELAAVGTIISKAEIIEYALAPVQSNRDAIIQTVAKGFQIPEYIKDELGLVIPDNPLAEVKEVEQQESVAIERVEAKRQPYVIGKSELYGRILSNAKSIRVDVAAAVKEALEAHKGKV